MLSTPKDEEIRASALGRQTCKVDERNRRKSDSGAQCSGNKGDQGILFVVVVGCGRLCDDSLPHCCFSLFAYIRTDEEKNLDMRFEGIKYVFSPGTKIGHPPRDVAVRNPGHAGWSDARIVEQRRFPGLKSRDREDKFN